MSIPLILPLCTTSSGFLVIPSSMRVFLTPSPSGMTLVAHEQAIRSMVLRSHLLAPFSPWNRNPVTRYIRFGTLVNLAAIMERRLPFGVLEWTMKGFSFLNILTSLQRHLKSDHKAMSRCMGTSITLIPSRSPTVFSSPVSAATPTTSNSLFRNPSCPSSSTWRLRSTVVTRMSLFIESKANKKQVPY